MKLEKIYIIGSALLFATTSSWALDLTCMVSGGVFATQSHFPGDKVRNNVNDVKTAQILFSINESSQSCSWGDSEYNFALFRNTAKELGCAFEKQSGPGTYGSFNYQTKTEDDTFIINSHCTS